MTELTLTIHMDSDWHIGSGTGRPGSIDRLVKRNDQGLPYIPAKTLTGILRDSCERVVLGLDNHQNGIWHQWLRYLFGDQPALAARESRPVESRPTHAVLSVRAAHLPIHLQSALKGKPFLQEALTFIKPGVKINSQSGVAEPECLRFEEMVRGGTVLEALCQLQSETLTSEELSIAQSLLAAGAAMVDRIGAKRRRGAGRCQMSLSFPLETAIACLTQYEHQTPPSPPVLCSRDSADIPDISSSSPNQDDWLIVDLLLETQSPVVLHKRTVGNVVETLDYIPGSYLLPIFAKKLRKMGVDADAAIANQDLIITHATPEIQDHPSRPIPFALSHEKLNKQNVSNGFLLPQPDSANKAPQRKGFRSGYVGAIEDHQPVLYKTLNCEVETHNTVNDDIQRPDATVGGVYSYEYIPPHQRFQAELRLRKLTETLNEETLVKALTESRELVGPGQHWLQIGRTRKDDYGLVSFEVRPSRKAKSNIPAESQLTVWLLSDVLLRDERLRPTTDLRVLTATLKTELGLDLTSDAPQVMARQRRTDSWQTRWDLPRPSLVGISAGTCLCYTLNRPPDPQKLAEVERRGIGERTVEGYGQLSFNDPLLTQDKPQLQELKESSASPSAQSTEPIASLLKASAVGEDTFGYARIVEREAWRSAIQRAILSLVATKELRRQLLGLEICRNPDMGNLESKPTMSQLGMLRSILQRLQSKEEAQIASVTSWLQKVQEKQADKWPSGSLERIRRFVTSDHVWDVLTEQLQAQCLELHQITMTDTGIQDLKKELWAESIRVLVDSCLRAHKRDLEKES